MPSSNNVETIFVQHSFEPRQTSSKWRHCLVQPSWLLDNTLCSCYCLSDGLTRTKRHQPRLLGGNSNQGATFGVSCDFANLEQNLLACLKCVRVEVALPMAFSCHICYGFSLPRLLEHGKYLTLYHSKLTVECVGFLEWISLLWSFVWVTSAEGWCDLGE
jgi:hypothetical protein